MRIVHFCHLPRTGGNYLVHALLSAEPGFRDAGFDVSPTIETLNVILEEGRDRYFLHGHTTLGVEGLLPGHGVRSFTLLREPRRRFVSEFLWQWRYHPGAGDLHTMQRGLRRWICMVDDGDHQTRMLSLPFAQRAFADAQLTPFDGENGPADLKAAQRTLESYAFVGFTEAMGEAVDAAADLLGVKLGHDPKVFNRSPGSAMAEALLAEPGVCASIDRLTSVDRQLYEWAQRFRLTEAA